jgi:hypothetical protein
MSHPAILEPNLIDEQSELTEDPRRYQFKKIEDLLEKPRQGKPGVRRPA